MASLEKEKEREKSANLVSVKELLWSRWIEALDKRFLIGFSSWSSYNSYWISLALSISKSFFSSPFNWPNETEPGSTKAKPFITPLAENSSTLEQVLYSPISVCAETDGGGNRSYNFSKKVGAVGADVKGSLSGSLALLFCRAAGGMILAPFSQSVSTQLFCKCECFSSLG